MTPDTSCAAPRGRLAPSPTGKLHLGNAFAFLMTWLDVRSLGGSLVLRMEDIDPVRSRPEFADAIIEDLQWLGLNWDEGPEASQTFAPYAQSERSERYAALLEDLTSRGVTYPCYCTRKELRTLASAPHIGDEGAPYPGTCRQLTAHERHEREKTGKRACLRLDTGGALALTGGGTSLTYFDDLVRGRQYITLQDCGGDFALRRSDGVYAYQLATAADDATMKITRVVRGEDLLFSTPRQLLLLKLMHAAPPAYAHIPLLHDHEGERLAKRHKSLELSALRESGVAPEAIIGYLGYLASLIDSPMQASPKELLPGFSLRLLPARLPSLPKDVVSLLSNI